MAATLSIHASAPHRMLRSDAPTIGEIKPAGKRYSLHITGATKGRYHVQSNGIELQLGDQGAGLFINNVRYGWIAHHGNNYSVRFDRDVITPVTIAFFPSKQPRTPRTYHPTTIRCAQPR